jgi:hypothetical protein
VCLKVVGTLFSGFLFPLGKEFQIQVSSSKFIKQFTAPDKAQHQPAENYGML